MFMTSALKKSDMKGMALQLAMEMMHEKDGKDVMTGLKTRTQPGRPNWGEVRKTFQPFQHQNMRKKNQNELY